MQTRIVFSLTTRMYMTPMAAPARNLHARRTSAANIVQLATELRQALDEDTGYGPDGRYRGLWVVQPYSVIQQIVGMRTGYRLDWPEMPEAFSVVYGVTLQDVLGWTAEHIASKTDEPTEELRQVPDLHVVMSRSLADWFAMIASEAGQDEFTVPRKACVETAAAFMRVHYPNEPINIRALG